MSTSTQSASRVLEAAKRGKPELVKAFFEAVEGNDLKRTAELLKEASLDVNTRNSSRYEQSALHIAANEGYLELARLLVDDYGADVNLKDKDEKVALQVATDTYNVDIVKFLLERNSEGREYAAHCLNSREVDELFEAAERNDLEKLRELVREGKVDVNSRDRSKYKRTVLHVAAERGYEELARLLVDELGADIQRDNEFGETAKNVAIDNGHEALAEFFLERGYTERWG